MWKTQSVCNGVLAQVVHRLWSLLLEDLQRLPGHGPEHLALGGPAGTGLGPGGHCQPQPSSDSLRRNCSVTMSERKTLRDGTGVFLDVIYS